MRQRIVRRMARSVTVELAPGVWRIPLIRDFVNGFMFRDDDGQVTLVDMGVAKSGPKVIAALRSIGSGIIFFHFSLNAILAMIVC